MSEFPDVDTPELDMVVVDGDGYRSEGQEESDIIATIPTPVMLSEQELAEIRGPELQEWIEDQMPHTD